MHRTFCSWLLLGVLSGSAVSCRQAPMAETQLTMWFEPIAQEQSSLGMWLSVENATSLTGPSVLSIVSHTATLCLLSSPQIAPQIDDSGDITVRPALSVEPDAGVPACGHEVTYLIRNDTSRYELGLLVRVPDNDAMPIVSATLWTNGRIVRQVFGRPTITAPIDAGSDVVDASPDVRDASSDALDVSDSSVDVMDAGSTTPDGMVDAGPVDVPLDAPNLDARETSVGLDGQ